LLKFLLFYKISGHFRAKNSVLKSPLVFNHPCLLTSTSAQRTKMVGESWDVFTKRVLVEKQVVLCMKLLEDDVENPGRGGGTPLPDHLCRRPRGRASLIGLYNFKTRYSTEELTNLTGLNIKSNCLLAPTICNKFKRNHSEIKTKYTN